MIMAWSSIPLNYPGVFQYGGNQRILKAERTFSSHMCDESSKILVAALVKMLAVVRDLWGPWTIGGDRREPNSATFDDAMIGVCFFASIAPTVYLGYRRFEHYARMAESLSSYSWQSRVSARNRPIEEKIMGNIEWRFDQAFCPSNLMLSRLNMTLCVHSNQIGLSLAARGLQRARDGYRSF